MGVKPIEIWGLNPLERGKKKRALNNSASFGCDFAKPLPQSGELWELSQAQDFANYHVSWAELFFCDHVQ